MHDDFTGGSPGVHLQANAHPAVLDRAQFVTQRPGGAGVIIELAELILRAKDRWPHA